MKEGDRPAFKRPLSCSDGINLVTSHSSEQLWIITRRWAVDGWVMSGVSTHGTDYGLRFKEGLGFVVVTKERR